MDHAKKGEKPAAIFIPQLPNTVAASSQAADASRVSSSDSAVRRDVNLNLLPFPSEPIGDLAEYVIEAARKKQFPTILQVLKRERKHRGSLRFTQLQELLLLHRACREDQWDSFLFFMHLDYRFHPYVLEAALYHAISNKRVDFVHAVIFRFPDLHLPWTVLMQAVGMMADLDQHVYRLKPVLRRLPPCVDPDWLRRVRTKLAERRVLAQHEADRRKIVRRMDAILDSLSSHTVSG